MNKAGESAGKVAMVGCFDTKAEVFHYLYQSLIKQGCSVIAINTGIYGSTELFPVDYENSWLLESIGESLDEVIAKGDRNVAVSFMSSAARQLLGRLSSEGKVSGVIGMGGGGGTYIVLNSMQDVVFGIPKICISTLAAKDVTHLAGIKDIMLIPSIVDVSGLNRIISVLIEQGAVAMAVMSKIKINQENEKKRIAISMFGNTTACVDTCTSMLKAKGYEVYAFHANGSGGKTMEEMIRGGYFDGVLDVTTTELADDLCGGICSAGSNRLTAASAMGIPQIVVPGCLDMVNFGSIESVPAQYAERNLYQWSPDVTLMRTNAEENRILGQNLAKKVSASAAPAVIIIPEKGLSQIDREGSPFYDAVANENLFESIEHSVGEDLVVLREEMHINDPDFATFLVDTMVSMLED